jgi:hypothetical protein
MTQPIISSMIYFFENYFQVSKTTIPFKEINGQVVILINEYGKIILTTEKLLVYNK